MKTTFFILLQSVLVALTYLSSEAYFCPVSKRSFNPNIIQNSELGGPTMASHIIVITGNQAFNNRSNSIIGYLSMNPDRHIYVSYLPVVEIVTQQSHQYMASEFSIDNLLYANLKLERLFIEYEGLKKRSQSILKNLDVPYLYGSRNFNNLIEKKNDGLNQSINRVANQKTSLAGPMANSNRWIEQKDASTYANGSRTATKKRLAFEKRTINYSYGDIFRVEAPSQKRGGGTTEPAPDPDNVNNNLQYGSKKENKLPWVERAMRSLLSYLGENKVETIVFLLFLFIVHQLIFSSRK